VPKLGPLAQVPVLVELVVQQARVQVELPEWERAPVVAE
jgi:hypothetical protein